MPFFPPWMRHQSCQSINSKLIFISYVNFTNLIYCYVLNIQRTSAPPIHACICSSYTQHFCISFHANYTAILLSHVLLSSWSSERDLRNLATIVLSSLQPLPPSLWSDLRFQVTACFWLVSATNATTLEAIHSLFYMHTLILHFLHLKFVSFWYLLTRAISTSLPVRLHCCFRCLL